MFIVIVYDWYKSNSNDEKMVPIEATKILNVFNGSDQRLVLLGRINNW